MSEIERVPSRRGGLHIYRTARIGLDLAVALPLLVLASPLLAIIALVIPFESRGPALFRQQRVGKDGKPFTIYKFRTMRPDAPTYSVKVDESDPSITRFGRFLRRTGLDELPQLWNVVRGEMSIIGPRPEQIELINLYEPWQLQRHAVRPGITGWWQIHHRDGAPLHLNVDKDLYYIEHQGLKLDALIVFGTLKLMFGALGRAIPRRRRQESLAATSRIQRARAQTRCCPKPKI